MAGGQLRVSIGGDELDPVRPGAVRSLKNLTVAVGVDAHSRDHAVAVAASRTDVVHRGARCTSLADATR
jgi:hypothetical protein